MGFCPRTARRAFPVHMHACTHTHHHRAPVTVRPRMPPRVARRRKPRSQSSSRRTTATARRRCTCQPRFHPSREPRLRVRVVTVTQARPCTHTHKETHTGIGRQIPRGVAEGSQRHGPASRGSAIVGTSAGSGAPVVHCPPPVQGSVQRLCDASGQPGQRNGRVGGVLRMVPHPRAATCRTDRSAPCTGEGR